jgi:diadenylate cyclase
MPGLRSPFLESWPEITPIAVIDVLAVAFLLYQFFLIIRGRRAVPIISGVITLIVVYAIALATGMGLLRTILEMLAPYSVFALIVMFQSDIRRVLARLGRRRLFMGQNNDRHDFSQEIVFALETLAQKRTGALIVLERDIGLRTFIESGVPVEGVLSRDLLLSVFHPGTAMHDGAVIVQGDRIAAAACFLPLSTNPRLMSTLGTRHRAAIGVTEETDCLSLVVSEETGRISVAAFGEIQTGLKLDDVERRIESHFGLDKKQRVLRRRIGANVPSPRSDKTQWRERPS